MTPLPRLMVAPNGARLGKADHAELPLTVEEILRTAISCAKAGADGLHLHLRDKNGGHLLDGGAYREAVAEISALLPELGIQATTEAAGKYAPAFQRRLALETGARMVSVAVREIAADGEIAACQKMYQACGERNISVQFIVYEPDDLAELAGIMGADAIESRDLQLLLVLGNHRGVVGAPSMLDGFLERMNFLQMRADWMACAFGRSETACLLKAHRRGGKLRVGFENSIWNEDGTRARDNATRVEAICAKLAALVD